MKHVSKLLIILGLFFILSSTNVLAAKCTVDGEEIPCDQFWDQYGTMMVLIFSFLGIFLLISLALWIAAVVHCARHPVKDRMVWIFILVITFVTGLALVGALLYYFIGRKRLETDPSKK